jgi:hypothetical protein
MLSELILLRNLHEDRVSLNGLAVSETISVVSQANSWEDLA